MEVGDDDLDNILDDALEDFSQPLPQQQQQQPQKVEEVKASSSNTNESKLPLPQNALEQQILEEFNDPEFQKGLEDFMKIIDPELANGLQNYTSDPEFLKEMANMTQMFSSFNSNPSPTSTSTSTSTKSTSTSKLQSTPTPSTSSSNSNTNTTANSNSNSNSTPTSTSTPNSKSNFQDAITNTMNKLKDSDQQVQSEIGEADGLSNLFSMLGDFNGESDSMSSMIESMMSQILSKEVLYEPMKELTELYPKWLADNKSTLSDDEYQRLQSQSQIMKNIVEVYDKQSDGSKDIGEVFELMQKLQDYGQPPPSLLQQMAPGADISAITDLNNQNCSIM